MLHSPETPLLKRPYHAYSAAILCVALLPMLTFAIDIDIAGETITVPTPSGFTAITEASGVEWFSLARDMYPSGNRLVAAFVSREIAGRLFLGEMVNLTQYIIVRSLTDVENATITENQFSLMLATIREQQDTALANQEDYPNLFNNAEEAIFKRTGKETELDITGMVSLGIDSETKTSLTMSFLQAFEMSQTGQKTGNTFAGTTTFLHVQGKIICIDAYKNYQGDEDLAWTRQQSQDIISAIESSNEVSELTNVGDSIGLAVDSILNSEVEDYSLKSHPKAMGLDMSLTYPESWQAKEGLRPHIVQKFTGDIIKGILPVIIVGVQKLPFWATLFLEEAGGEELLLENLMGMAPTDAEFIEGNRTEIDGEPGAWLKFYIEAERSGAKAGMFVLQYVLFYDGRMVFVECSLGSAVDNKDQLKGAFNLFLPVFQRIGNSIVIHDKWAKGSDVSFSGFMKEAFGRWWQLVLTVSAFLTLGMGVVVPLLIRYGILRQPMKKWSALIYTANTVLLNCGVFAFCEVASATYAVILFWGCIPYGILRKGCKLLGSVSDAGSLNTPRQNETDYSASEEPSISQLLEVEQSYSSPVQTHRNPDEKYMPPEMRRTNLAEYGRSQEINEKPGELSPMTANLQSEPEKIIAMPQKDLIPVEVTLEAQQSLEQKQPFKEENASKMPKSGSLGKSVLVATIIILTFPLVLVAGGLMIHLGNEAHVPFTPIFAVILIFIWGKWVRDFARGQKNAVYLWGRPADDHYPIECPQDHLLSETMCSGCGTPLRHSQVENMVGNPECNEWSRRGYCCYSCFETFSKATGSK